MNINPQGYEYGKEPINKNPFWEDVDIFDQYVKDIQLSVEEGAENNNFKISYTNQDNEVIELPSTIYYMTPEQIHNMISSDIPVNYVKFIQLSNEEDTQNSKFKITYTNQNDEVINVMPEILYMTPEQITTAISSNIPNEYIKDVTIGVTQGDSTTTKFTFTKKDNTTYEESLTYLTPEQVDTKVEAAKTEIQEQIPAEFLTDTSMTITEKSNIPAPYTQIDLFKTKNDLGTEKIGTFSVFQQNQLTTAIRHTIRDETAKIQLVSAADVSIGGITQSKTTLNQKSWEFGGTELSDWSKVGAIEYVKPINIINFVNNTLEGNVGKLRFDEGSYTDGKGLKISQLIIKYYPYKDGKLETTSTTLYNLTYVKPADLEAYVDNKLGGT